MLEEEEILDFSQYAILLKGIVCVGHVLQCSSCKACGPSYINMNAVKDDKLVGCSCPLCGEETLEIVTYQHI